MALDPGEDGLVFVALRRERRRSVVEQNHENRAASVRSAHLSGFMNHLVEHVDEHFVFDRLQAR